MDNEDNEDPKFLLAFASRGLEFAVREVIATVRREHRCLEFLRTARSISLEIKSDDAEEMRRRILDSALVRTLEMPDPRFYFQAPGR